MYSAIYERRLSVGICRGELTQTGRGLNQNIWYFFVSESSSVSAYSLGLHLATIPFL